MRFIQHPFASKCVAGSSRIRVKTGLSKVLGGHLDPTLRARAPTVATRNFLALKGIIAAWTSPLSPLRATETLVPEDGSVHSGWPLDFMEFDACNVDVGS